MDRWQTKPLRRWATGPGGPRLRCDLYVDDDGTREPVQLHAHDRLDCYVRGDDWEIEVHLDDHGAEAQRSAIPAPPSWWRAGEVSIYIDDTDSTGEPHVRQFARSVRLYLCWNVAGTPTVDDLHINDSGKSWTGEAALMVEESDGRD